ncbi:MAG: VOC family protein [Propionibacteriaceae bacterium]|jgi:PhnB protein|nr:VOC family protein [Propionibacteriaceae bacterium]
MFGHYLMFNGDCAEALKAYAAAWGAEISECRTYGDIPNPGFPVPDEQRNRVLHARLTWQGGELLCADAGRTVQGGSNMYVSITLPDESAVRHAWGLLAEDATVYMELAPTFFATAHGSLQDRFGVNWMFTVPSETV